ncbi:ORC-CDC6 family AAA ATPase [Ferruginibacter sp.]|nr:hypothetical protein [Ferruginibacter sp.]
MTENINPFSKYRTEYMGDSAWKYFVKDPFKQYIGEKPLIFEGSRGTGKTMFFLCNSWKQKLQAAKAEGASLKDFLNSNTHIGFYYKVDTRFVKSMDKKNIEESIWTGIFNTYFNVVIGKEIIAFLNLLLSEGVINDQLIKKTAKHICTSLDMPLVDNLEELNDRFNDVIIKIEHFSNNTEREKPIGINAGTIIQSLLLSVKDSTLFTDKTFHVFIDEFESLNYNQQVELNTLLKHSDNNIVYDFGVMTRGIQTFKTGTGQEIRPKDDFSLLSTDKYEYHESDNYNNLLVEICKKRLKDVLDKTGKPYDESFLDIQLYLKKYPKGYEENLFERSNDLEKIKQRIMVELKKSSRIYAYSIDETNLFYKELAECKPIVMRMHLALLLRKGKYTIAPKDLVAHKGNNTDRYKDWLHNMENAVVYLLCHELKIEKRYHGFKVFSALSSGVIRSFLELAEYAFDYAFNNSSNPFSFTKPRSFDIEEQTKAVYFVSRFKVAEIDSYEPSGLQLKTFTIAIGKIFSALHTDPNSTLGEVEFNHFTTKINDLRKERQDAAILLKHAVMHKILEEAESTKTKSDDIVELMDFHLNHIYCPAFRISHLRKRKLPISPIDLAKLFCGSQKELEDVVNKLSSYTEDNIPNLFSETDELSREI